MAADPKWYDSADVPLEAPPPISGSGGDAGGGTPATLRLYNDKDEAGADTMQSVRLSGFARTSSSGQALASGHPLVDRRMVEARIVQGLGGKTVGATGWQELGGGAALSLPSLASGEGVELEFRLNAPSDAQGDNPFLVLRVAYDTSVSMGPGHSELVGDGVYLGVSDPRVTVLVDGEDVLENPAGADDQVRVGVFVWIAAGVPYAYHQQLVEVLASTTGTSRYVLLSLAADGSLTLTDGVESASPLGDGDKPALPAGELPVAYVHRDDTAAIQQADIQQVYQRGFCHVDAAAQTATVAPGTCMVDNRQTYSQAPEPVTLTLSATNRLWRQRDGSLAVTTTDAPPVGSRALLLAEVDTDAVGVTAIRDRRRFVGHRLHRVGFAWTGVLATGEYRYAISPSDRTAYVLPIAGMRAAVGVPGTGSGSTRWLVEVDPAYDDTWAALTTSDTAPEITFAAGDPRDIDGVPADFVVPPGARLRASLDAVPSGADAADAVLDLLLVEV